MQRNIPFQDPFVYEAAKNRRNMPLWKLNSIRIDFSLGLANIGTHTFSVKDEDPFSRKMRRDKRTRSSSFVSLDSLL